MPKQLGTITVPVLNTDPVSPSNGDLWYNSTLNKFRKQENNTVSDMDTNSGSSLAVVEYEIDFGTVPTSGKKFTITDAAALSTSKIIVSPSGKPATGRGSDDWLWDAIQFSALSANGSFTLFAKPIGTKVMGKRKILYTIN